MNVRVTSAGAGTGKTWWLAEHLAGALLAGDRGARVRPEGVVAITFTRKAAAELESRLRRRLIEAGEWAMAHALSDGYIGTFHSVGQRLLREFALEGGLSPEQRVIPESEEERLFREALGAVAEEEDHARLDAAARRMAMNGWRDDLQRVIDLARANRLGPEELARCRERSLAGLFALLPPAVSAADRDRALLEELEAVRLLLDAEAGRSGAAADRARVAAQLEHTARKEGAPSWRDQLAALKVLGGVQRVRAFAGELCDLLEAHTADPRYHDDLRAMVEGVFGLAERVLAEYEARKRSARTLDYGDMLADALALLGRPGVREALEERLELVLVDEFQDVSPMQLALVMRLSRLAGRAAWVGDPKQAIFGFQGSDPELVQAATEHVLGERAPEYLGKSYRSRAPLVELSSDLFAGALAPHGFPEEAVRIEPAHPDPPELAGEAPFECWAWDPAAVEGPEGRARPGEPESIAEGVEELLREAPLVRERTGDPAEVEVRAAAPRDVAVLVRTNEQGRKVAAALRGRGLPATVALGGLMEQPEARLARAALALVADPDDGVAAAEVAWLSGGAARDPDRWLARRIEEEARWRAAVDGAGPDDDRPPRPRPFDDDPRVRALRELSARADDRSPAEAFALALDAADLHRLCLAWPESGRRLPNLEALRALATDYEELCRIRRSAATTAGLVRHLAEQEGGGRSSKGAEQATPTEADAVQVSTYHRAKGLEWPVVVLAQLDYPRKADPFGVHLEPPEGEFDAERPLAGRWIRYWPWPYGAHSSGVELAENAAQTPAARRVSEQEARERARLMYVGVTRARDRVVFVGRKKEGEAASVGCLDELRGADGGVLLELPWGEEGERVVRVRGAGREWPCPVRMLAGIPPESPARSSPRRRWFPRGQVGEERPPEVLTPSSAEALEAFEAGRVETIGPRSALTGRTTDMARFGDAVHAFLAWDVGGGREREEAARRLLAEEDLLDVLLPESLAAMGDAFGSWIRSSFPGARAHAEWPVRRRVPQPGSAGGERLLAGEVDLVLEVNGGLVIVDHKAYEGEAEGRDARLPGYAAQLSLYAGALESATGKKVTGAYVHLPLLGEVVHMGIR